MFLARAITILVVMNLTNILVKSENLLFLVQPIYSVIRPIVPAVDELYNKYGHRTSILMPKSLAEMDMIKNSSIDVIRTKRFDSEYDIPAYISEVIQSVSKGEWYWGLKYQRFLKDQCEFFLSDPELYKELKRRNIKFTVVVNSAMAMCLNIVPYKLNVPFMHYGKNYDPVNERIPYTPSFIPAAPIAPYDDHMNFFERILNLFLFSVFTLVQDICSPWEAVKKYAPERPYISTTDLWKQAQFHLLEFDPVIDYSRPVFQNYAFIGGIGTGPANPLKGKFKEFVESSDVGVVIVSFGSLAKGFPDHIIDKFITGFNSVESLKFVFKHDNLSLSNEKLLISPWLPQNDLLGHRNTKLFITHCGNGGQFEGLYHGIPMLGFPLFQEQHVNARRALKKGFGITMKIYDFTVDELVHNINILVTNSSYKTAIAKASEIFRGRPKTPDQRMAYWIDHVIKYGGEYMRPASLDIPWYQYLMLDVLFLILVATGTCLRCLLFIRTRIKRCKSKID